jgi:hypothetical protein
MVSIDYYAKGFDRSWGFRRRWCKLNVDWFDLVWAAVSVGKLGLDDLMAHGQFSIDEIRSRYYLIYSHLMQNQGAIIKSPLYESMDSTEKGAASYFIGMAASKLVGAFLLEVPWLVHLEKIQAIYDIGLSGRSRPDLLGKNNQGKWVVFEAKGRTHGFSQDAINKAKTQTGRISHVSGSKPVLRVATESFFDPNLCIFIEDPNEKVDDAFSIKLEESQFYRSYYSTFSYFSQLDPRRQWVDNYHYDFIDNESIGVSVGINHSIIENLERIDISTKSLRDIPSNIYESREEKWGITKYYPDGVAIVLDEKRWGSEMMSIEPSLR